jgi:cytochrome c-type biogenesis protein CcmH/NrfF
MEFKAFASEAVESKMAQINTKIMEYTKQGNSVVESAVLVAADMGLEIEDIAQLISPKTISALEREGIKNKTIKGKLSTTL